MKKKKWVVIAYDNRKTFRFYFETKKKAINYLKEIYLNDHVPFFELDSQGRLDSFTFKEFLSDFIITKLK